MLFGLLLTQKEPHAYFFSEEVIKKLRVSQNTLTLKARNAIFLLIGFFIIIALAQPVIKDGLVEVKAKSADIMIAIDISDSMLATDVYPNRLESAKQKALALLNEAPNERIGVVAFAKNSYLVSPLSFDTNAVAFLLGKLDTTSITEKGTDFTSILDVVSKTEKNQDKKYLLILSDGGDETDFSQEIELAKRSNITVFVLGVATKSGSPIRIQDGSFIKYNGETIVSKLNEKIADLAVKTGGVYIESTTSFDDIKRMFKEITAMSDEKELKSQEVQKFIPLFYYPLGVALALLLIATSSIDRRKNINAVFMLIVAGAVLNSSYAMAGMLDFIDLKNAKTAYEKGDFTESAKIYEEYAKSSGSGDGYFNAGNAFYKEKKYKEAIESYKKATFENDEAKARNLSNLGNAYAKEAKQDSLQKAIEAYEKSLALKEDKDTRENLQEVEKLFKKQKQDSKENRQKPKNKEQDKENQQGGKNQNSKDNEKRESEKKSDEKDSPKDKEPKDKEKEANEKNSQKDELNELDKNSKNASKKSQTNNMSEAEEQKWIEQLNTNSGTRMYRLNDEKPSNKNRDEKPW